MGNKSAKRVYIKQSSDIIFIMFGSLEKIPMNNHFLYEIFFELSQRNKFKKFFKNLVFDTTKFSPYCETVKFVVDHISRFGLVEWKDGENFYKVLPSFGKKVKEKLSSGLYHDDDFNKMLEDFKKSINGFSFSKEI